jgi:dCMP deaminase
MNKQTRPSWEEYFFQMAHVASTRSTCLRRQVGAVIVRDNQILTTGYNGAPAGTKHCIDIGCMRQQQNIPSGERHELCRGGHAEQNAISQAAKHGININNSIIYCTLQPCSMCAKAIINAGIKKVLYQDGYMDDLTEKLFTEANIEVRRVRV